MSIAAYCNHHTFLAGFTYDVLLVYLFADLLVYKYPCAFMIRIEAELPEGIHDMSNQEATEDA
jgi:hypothetical protein